MVAALPPTVYLVLLELAVGGLVALLLVDLRDEVPRGFTLFTIAVLWLAAFGAHQVSWAFPGLIGDGPGWSSTAGVARPVLLVLLGSYGLATGTRMYLWRRATGAAAGLAAVAALVSSSLAVRGEALGGLAVPLSVLVGSVALGGATVGMVLGHWYLVTPRLPEKPLVRLTGLLAAALAAQVLLLPLPLLASTGATLDDLAYVYWLRVGFAVVFPLVLAVMVWMTARVRSMQSATGLLYLEVALVAAGEIMARSLYFGTGAPV